MPFISRIDYFWGVVAVWRISESEEELRRYVSQSDLDSIRGLNAPSRRVERLSWRALLRSLAPGIGDVIYDQSGAPHVDEWHLSVSHSRDYAVVALSESHRCAVDVESVARDFNRIAARYVTSEEMVVARFCDMDLVERKRCLCGFWSIKEVLYKYSGVRELDFLKNMKVCLYSGDRAVGEISQAGEIQRLDLSIIELDGALVVVGIEAR